MSRWPRLVESLKDARIITVNGYDYFVHPLTDGVPQIQPELLREATQGLRSLLPPRFDRYLTAEAMGIPLASALSLATGHPFLIARKRSYGFPGEVPARFGTGYHQGTLYLNDVRRHEALVIIDDVISQGGTLRALVRAAETAGARVTKAVLLFNKGLDLGGLSDELGLPVQALIDVRVRAGTVEAVA